jgi:hypothetical protein
MERERERERKKKRRLRELQEMDSLHLSLPLSPRRRNGYDRKMKEKGNKEFIVFFFFLLVFFFLVTPLFHFTFF